MTGKQGTTSMIDVKALLEGDGDYLRAMVRAVVEATLEAEMTVALGAEKGERSEGRLGYRSGTTARTLVTRVGTLELRVPQDRDGSVLDPAVRALPAVGEGVGCGAGGDVRAGGVDAEGEGDHRGTVRARLLGLGDQRGQQDDGCRALGLHRAASSGRRPSPT